MQAASAPIVPFKAALRMTLCQAVGPVAGGGLSGILIGLALSLISGGVLYCKTGLCAIDTIIEIKKKNRASGVIHATHTDHESSKTLGRADEILQELQLPSCPCKLIQLVFYFTDFFFLPSL